MKSPPPGWPRISTSLYYDDAAAAIDWLCEAFGFQVRIEITDEEGNVEHSELTYGDGLIMIDSGSIIAEGTVDELKKRTGSDYCEIVPKDPADLPAIATALTPMLPDEARAAMSLDVDRLTVPAFDGANTLVEAIRLLDHAGIALTDVALRRPSLDDVFFALTADPAS